MFKNFSWNAVVCGLSGHVTYEPTDEGFRGRLRVSMPWGDAWRCLRCGEYVVGAPHGTGPASRAPRLRRGNALKDAIVVRVLAIDKGVKGFFKLMLAAGIFAFNGHQHSARQALDVYIPLLRPFLEQLGVNVDDLAIMHMVDQALALSGPTVILAGCLVAAYGLVNMTEGVSLWMMKRWGEYLASVATAAFVPFEIHEIVLKVSVPRISALVINLFLVAYLVISKRLFGVRGGAQAYEAQRQGESLMEIEVAAAGLPASTLTDENADDPQPADDTTLAGR